MPVETLIDGYNLLFTAGYEGRSRQRGWLERARRRLVDFLNSKLSSDEQSRTLIVFDVTVDVIKSQRLMADDWSRPEVDLDRAAVAGIQVVFAFGFEEADDMLESLIRKHSVPKILTVVSSDHRIQRRAAARRATAIDSEDYLRWLESRSQESADSPTRDKSPEDPLLSEEEIQRWMREFGEGD